jgi:hypothetical protein
MKPEMLSNELDPSTYDFKRCFSALVILNLTTLSNICATAKPPLVLVFPEDVSGFVLR